MFILWFQCCNQTKFEKPHDCNPWGKEALFLLGLQSWIYSKDTSEWSCQSGSWRKKAIWMLTLDLKFSQSSHRKTHIKRVHENNKPYQCSICIKSFACNQSMSLHILAVHEKKKPHECHICQQKFSQKSSLTLHLKNVHKLNDYINWDLNKVDILIYTHFNDRGYWIYWFRSMLGLLL